MPKELLRENEATDPKQLTPEFVLQVGLYDSRSRRLPYVKVRGILRPKNIPDYGLP